MSADTPDRSQPNETTIVHRFIWRWAVARGVDPSVGGKDIDNEAWLDEIVSRLGSSVVAVPDVEAGPS